MVEIRSVAMLKEGCYVGIINCFGANQLPLFIDKITVDIHTEKINLEFDSGYELEICVFCYDNFELDKNNIVGDYIIFASENPGAVLSWIAGYEASCKVLKEFIHI